MSSLMWNMFALILRLNGMAVRWANFWRFQCVSIFHHSSIIVIIFIFFLVLSVLVPRNFQPLQSLDYTVGGATFKCDWEELLFATPNRNAQIVWHCFNGARKKKLVHLGQSWFLALEMNTILMADEWLQFGTIAVGICRCWSCWLVQGRQYCK